ncbi:glycosyltransferase family 87 protein [Nocardia tengchongensis]|uniref:glycosyltransferase family 87 protein n=1 Tax=Nocardia tengchongensis TaxID=2055889 RepID=UPI0036B7306E
MPNRPAVSAAATRRRDAGRSMIAVLSTLVCGVTLLLAYVNKARCAVGPFDESGRSVIFDVIKDSDVCYSDIQYLWLGRGIDHHVFPYITGGITPDGQLTGGAVEYPVLSGLFMWIGGLGSRTDADFLWHSALLLAPFALLTAYLLARMAGPAALLWAATPPLVLYAFHNWELPVVATAVAAFYVMTVLTRYSLRDRAIAAAVFLAIGFCFKLYPGIFVLPLLIYVLLGEHPLREKRFDVRGALMVAATAIGTVVAINLPFALAGYDGWRASITFQQLRQADITTNSLWYWGLRPLFGPTQEAESTFQSVVSVASPLLVLASFALACWLGVRRYRLSGVYPWIGVSGAMLCGFLLFHKVHSPQYTLWLIPFLVLLEVPWSLVVTYLMADLCIGIGVFRYFYALGAGNPYLLEQNLVQIGVWGRAVLLAVFFFLFVNAGARSVGRVGVPGPESLALGPVSADRHIAPPARTAA